MYARSVRGGMKKTARNYKGLGLAVTLVGGGITLLVLASALCFQRKTTGAAPSASRPLASFPGLPGPATSVHVLPCPSMSVCQVLR